MPRAGVVGQPIAHSLSPLLHRTAYDALGLSDWSYGAAEVGPGGLAAYVDRLAPDWVGLSVTMPLKEEALALAVERTATARLTGAVNTLTRGPAGWRGANTDVVGLVEALRPALSTASAPTQAVVLGSGATARSALAALAQLGVRRVTLVVRDQARPATIEQARAQGLAIEVRREGDVTDAALSAHLVVSTLPAHAADAVADAVLASAEGSSPGPEGRVWLDVVYAGWPTRLAQVGTRMGVQVVSGVDMLVHQAAAQVSAMTGHPAPTAAMLAAGRAALGHPVP